MTNELFSLILRDAAFLLTPVYVTELTTSSSSTAKSETAVSSHSHGTSILALSDLHDVFSIEYGRDGIKERTGYRRRNHITQKLIFYAAHILSTPTIILRALVQEMMDKAQMISSG